MAEVLISAAPPRLRFTLLPTLRLPFAVLLCPPWLATPSPRNTRASSAARRWASSKGSGGFTRARGCSKGNGPVANGHRAIRPRAQAAAAAAAAAREQALRGKKEAEAPSAAANTPISPARLPRLARPCHLGRRRCTRRRPLPLLLPRPHAALPAAYHLACGPGRRRCRRTLRRRRCYLA